MKHYAQRDILGQGQPYCDHVLAMTSEKLHCKSDIAAELAHRDIRITELERQPIHPSLHGKWRIQVMSKRILAASSAACLLFFISPPALALTKGDICRAYIATAYGRDINIIKHIADNNHGQSMVGYTRSDGSKYEYACQYNGNKVTYSMFLADENRWGRMRHNETATFSVNGNKVTINDPMNGAKTFIFN